MRDKDEAGKDQRRLSVMKSRNPNLQKTQHQSPGTFEQKSRSASGQSCTGTSQPCEEGRAASNTPFHLQAGQLRPGALGRFCKFMGGTAEPILSKEGRAATTSLSQSQVSEGRAQVHPEELGQMQRNIESVQQICATDY